MNCDFIDMLNDDVISSCMNEARFVCTVCNHRCCEEHKESHEKVVKSPAQWFEIGEDTK